MNIIKLLEEGKNLEAMKEIKSKMDGFKSGKLIDKEEELAEKYSGKQKNIKESTLIKEGKNDIKGFKTSPKGIVEFYLKPEENYNTKDDKRIDTIIEKAENVKDMWNEIWFQLVDKIEENRDALGIKRSANIKNMDIIQLNKLVGGKVITVFGSVAMFLRKIVDEKRFYIFSSTFNMQDETIYELDNKIKILKEIKYLVSIIDGDNLDIVTDNEGHVDYY